MNKSMTRRLVFALAALAIGAAPISAAATSPDESTVDHLLAEPQANLNTIRSFGPDVLPVLADIYEQSDERRRAVIAWVFYNLGWKSESARQVLMQDLHTTHESLRLQVQWALGRVSNNPVVVDALLDNLRNDANPLFRDKAACALAYDQIHLSQEQKVRVFEGLIEALSDDNRQIRSVSIKALKIQTGQTKGFRANAPITERRQSIRQWKAWLREYYANL